MFLAYNIVIQYYVIMDNSVNSISHLFFSVTDVIHS